MDYKGDTPSLRVRIASPRLPQRVPRSAVKGKVVVVGATYPSLHDLHATSTTGSGLMPGPEIQASCRGDRARGLPAEERSRLGQIVTIVVMGMLAPLARPPPADLPRAGRSASSHSSPSSSARRSRSTRRPRDHRRLPGHRRDRGAASSPARSTASGPSPSSASRRATPSRASSRRRSSARCCAAPTTVRLGGVLREGTVMFSDLRGFTTFAESMSRPPRSWTSSIATSPR